jgi:UDP-2,3-diacylglucosamine pyrophosphatase LpxH
VVLGHTHRPQYYKENGSVYVNTGDWMDSFTYGKLEAGVLSLERWSDQTES